MWEPSGDGCASISGYWELISFLVPTTEPPVEVRSVRQIAGGSPLLFSEYTRRRPSLEKFPIAGYDVSRSTEPSLAETCHNEGRFDRLETKTIDLPS